MTRIINLDRVASEPEVTIVVDGKKHHMAPPTVQSFIDNMTLIAQAGKAKDPVMEMEIGIKIIQRAFPTISEAEMRLWTLERIAQLSEISRGQSGEIVTDDPEEAASGNARKANSKR